MRPLLTLHNPAVAKEYYAKGYWQNDTYYTLLERHAAQQPEAYALQDSTRRLTYRELLNAVDQFAAELHGMGLVQGERLSIWLPNCVESVVVFLACSRNGYVANPSLHQNHTVAEVVACLDRLQVSVLVAKRGYGADAQEHDIFEEARKVGSVRRLISLGDKPAANHGLRFDDLSYGADLSVQPAPDNNPDKIVYLAFTSGTTGEPKGVMHSDNTLLANGRALVNDWGVNAETIIYSLSPLSHHIGTVAISQALVGGCELVINDLPSRQSPIDHIEQTGATYVMGVPTHALDLLSELDRRGSTALGHVKTFYMAGAAIPRSLAERFLKLGIRPQNVYGMTENGSHQYTLPSDDVDTIVGTCGRSAFGFETAIFDAENPDRPLPIGEVGEIGTRGALLMLGYFANQRATENSFNRLGWFLSGDLGQMDDNGCLSIVGRKKDLIIRGGHNIHPTHIEALAIRHPHVKSVAAIPVPDDRLGERVCLVVRPLQDRTVAADEILAFLHEQGLSKYDMPEFFLSVEDFPMTASGKILKRKLVEFVQEGVVTPTAVRWVDPAKQNEVSNGN